MKILLTLFLLLIYSQTVALGQTATREFSPFEFYGGFSYTRFNFDRHSSPISTEPDGVPAIELSATYNATRLVGLKGAFKAGYRSQRFFDVFPPPCRPGDMRPECGCVTALTCPQIDFQRKLSLYEFLGGVQIKDNVRQARVKPFAHLLAGVARLDQTFYPNPEDPDPPLCPACRRFSLDRNSFTMDLGGGLDVGLSRRIDFRVFQITYNPTFLGNGTQHNLTLGAGLVFR